MINGVQVRNIAEKILRLEPNEVVRVRLLRDVLHLAPSSPELREAVLKLSGHAWVRQLEQEQHPDGSWGRFHSMDSSKTALFRTSETAIRRALSLGLEKNHPILARASRYMRWVLEGKAKWSDRVEKSEGWPICVEAITAATLAEVDPAHPACRPAWDYWVEVVGLSFQAGKYDPEAERQAHKDHNGRGTRYLGSRYVLTLLGRRSDELPAAIETRLLDWVWDNPEGIGYLGVALCHPDRFHIFNWLESLEILSWFPSWRAHMKDAVAWLWERRNADGLWDFGARVSKCSYFPLSDDWRKNGNRSIDHSTRILSLLSKYDPGI